MFYVIIESWLGNRLSYKRNELEMIMVCYLKIYLFRLIIVKYYIRYRVRGLKDKWELGFK